MSWVKDFLDLFGGSITNLLGIVIVVVVVIIFFLKIQRYLMSKFNEDYETHTNTEKILEATNRIPQIEKKINELEANQQEQMSRIDEIEKENRRRECSQLRERIMQSYRFQCDPTHNPMHAITELEQKAFLDAYEEYIEAGGDGYVKERIRGDFDTLTVIPMADTERIAELMHSRK